MKPEDIRVIPLPPGSTLQEPTTDENGEEMGVLHIPLSSVPQFADVLNYYALPESHRDQLREAQKIIAEKRMAEASARAQAEYRQRMDEHKRRADEQSEKVRREEMPQIIAAIVLFVVFIVGGIIFVVTHK